MTITIRPAREADIPAILHGYFKVNEHSPMGTAYVLSAERIRRDILSAEPKAYIDIAEVDDEFAGFVFYSSVYFASTGQVVWVTDIYIDPFARGAGIPKKFRDAMQQRFPDAHGLYGVTEKTNTRAKAYFCSQGAHVYDHFDFIGIKESA
jgi:L-amino acid N-acyltransferase YncA